MDPYPTRTAAAGPFSTQPSGPRPVGCFSALLARPVSIQIWALRSRLEKQPTDLRRNRRDLGDGALDAGKYYKRRVEQGRHRDKPRTRREPEAATLFSLPGASIRPCPARGPTLCQEEGFASKRGPTDGSTWSTIYLQLTPAARITCANLH